MTQSSRLSALYGVIDYFYQRLVLPSISGSQEKKSSFKVVDIDWIRYFILATKRAHASGTNLTFDTLLEALKSVEMLVRQGYQTYDFIH